MPLRGQAEERETPELGNSEEERRKVCVGTVGLHIRSAPGKFFSEKTNNRIRM